MKHKTKDGKYNNSSKSSFTSNPYKIIVQGEEKPLPEGLKVNGLIKKLNLLTTTENKDKIPQMITQFNDVIDCISKHPDIKAALKNIEFALVIGEPDGNCSYNGKGVAEEDFFIKLVDNFENDKPFTQDPEASRGNTLYGTAIFEICNSINPYNKLCFEIIDHLMTDKKVYAISAEYSEFWTGKMSYKIREDLKDLHYGKDISCELDEQKTFYPHWVRVNAKKENSHAEKYRKQFKDFKGSINPKIAFENIKYYSVEDVLKYHCDFLATTLSLYALKAPYLPKVEKINKFHDIFIKMLIEHFDKIPEKGKGSLEEADYYIKEIETREKENCLQNQAQDNITEQNNYHIHSGDEAATDVLGESSELTPSKAWCILY